MIPTKCKMPDISDLDFPLKKYLLVRALVGDKGITKKEGLYRRNFIRLVDKAIKEYQCARITIIAQIDEAKRPATEMIKHGRSLPIIEFPDYFEDCINAINRLLKQLDIIKSEPDSWGISRQLRRAVEAHSRTIPSIRNTAEHMEEYINVGKLKDGQPVMFAVGDKGDTAKLARYELRFDDVALAIRGLHSIALDLLKKKN